MKNANHFIVMLAAVASLLSSCHQDEHPKTSQLKEYIFDGRHFVFYYNNKGNVDSIRAVEKGVLLYQFSVKYTGTKIDSSWSLMNGKVMSLNKNFVYNTNGQITSFLYHAGEYPYVYESVNPLTYDAQGNVKTLKINGTYKDSIIYDNDHTVIATTGGFLDGTYTNDMGINPFYNIPNLFVVAVEEYYLWEFCFSKHNSTSRTFPVVGGTSTIHYQNEYDSKGRLIRKTATGNGEDHVFEYLY